MKKIWKRAAAALCAAGLLFGSLLSCSSGDDDDDNGGSVTPPETPIIDITAPEAAGTVTLTADSEPATKLYEGNSVQKALEKLMEANGTGSYTIKVAPGTYHEMLFYTGPATITIEGTGSASYGTDVLITYSNSGNSNAMSDLASSHGVTSGYTRGATRFDGTCNLVFKNITIQNSYSRSANDGKDTQAEALVFSSTGNLIAYNSTFLSHQDTLYLGNKGGRMWFYKDYIAGDVDFIWGYMDVALFEECSIYCRSDETDKAYIFASRAMAEDEVNKGIVLLNNKIEIASGVTTWYGRNSGSDTNAAILNSTITGAGTLKPELYQSAPTKYVTDAAGDLAIGYKDYNNTMNGTLVDGSGRLNLCGALSERVAKREYNGRYVILNRGYSEEDKLYKTGTTIWDISAYEEEFNATADDSAENVYVDPVHVKNMIGGETVQLTPSSDVENLTYTYASSDTSVATVNESGLVTTVEKAKGTAVITMTASNGKTDTMTVAVIPEAIPVTKMTLSLGAASVAKYGITTAKVALTPADATEQEYTLTSSDSKVMFYDPSAQKLAQTITATGVNGSSEIYVWVGSDVSDVTLTATSTSATTVTTTATVSTAEGKATWCAQAGSYRVKTDIQGGKYGIFDGLVIDSLAANSSLISENGKMSLKTAERMQTRNVIFYIPVEGASTVKINLSAAGGCSYHVGDAMFSGNDDNTAFTYTYDGSKTGIVLGSEISGLGAAQATVGEIVKNGKYLRVDVVKDSGDAYITSIDVEKTGDFTASWDETTQTGAEGTYNFGSADYVDSNNNYASTDGFVTGTGITADGQNHGYAVAADSTITIKVGGMAKISLIGCEHGNGAGFTATAGGGTLATEDTTNVPADNTVGAVFVYKNAEAADVLITFTNSGWIHGITVEPLDEVVPVSGITISQKDSLTSVNVSETLALTATVEPANATDNRIAWTSSNTDVATVNQQGVVTGVSAGTATITATAKDGSGVKGEFEVEVSENTKTWEDYASEDASWIPSTDTPEVSGKTAVWNNMVIVAANGDTFKCHEANKYFKVNATTSIVLYIPMTKDGTITIEGDNNCSPTVTASNDTVLTKENNMWTYNYQISEGVKGSTIGELEGIEATGTYAKITFSKKDNTYCQTISRTYNK